MRFIFLMPLLFCSFCGYPQKPAIDSDAFRKWAKVGGGSISNDGKFITYQVYNKDSVANTLVVISSSGKGKMEVPGGYAAAFTADSRMLVFKTGAGMLKLLTLGTDECKELSGISEYKIPENGTGRWLAYRPSALDQRVVLRELITGSEQQFSNVWDYRFESEGETLLLAIRAKDDTTGRECLKWINLNTGEVKDIWSGNRNERYTGNYAFSPNGDGLGFIVEEQKNKRLKYRLWVYTRRMDTAVLLAADGSSRIEGDLEVANGRPWFDKSDSLLFFYLKSSQVTRDGPAGARVDVWSYRDVVLQSLQTETRNYGDLYYKSVVNTHTGQISQLETDHEELIDVFNGIALVRSRYGVYDELESYWDVAARPSYWFVSIKDGTKRLFKDHVVNPFGELGVSPSGRWIIFFDFGQRCYFSYDMVTGATRNISKGSHADWTDEEKDKLGRGDNLAWSSSQATWVGDDEAVIVYDKYDVWQLDPSGNRAALNLTNGYGASHGIKFELAEGGNYAALHTLTPAARSPILLSAVDKSNKDRGFFRARLGVLSDPDKLSMGAYVYGEWDGVGAYNYPITKARGKNAWLFLRMSLQDAPNYFYTNNFRQFTRLSDIQPQKAYNWMTAELAHWKTFAGKDDMGILYKPENFDAHKQYPIIFTYYELRSAELNLFLEPRPATNRINIPWLVSNGYLVFVPDILYTPGRPGQSAYDCVVSAAKHFASQKWVNPRRMGIQGHSFGGYETNYIVTHSTLFAAACSASGFCDLISWYTAGTRGGFNMNWAENDQGRIGATPWQRPDLYVSNSPIYRADKVTTPLLLMNNRSDQIVPFAQGVAFFSALRRLGKRVWMLQYDNEGHSLYDTADALDYNIRMTQFFDHYLKGFPAPVWMTRGVPAEKKWIDNGLEIDQKMATPGPGLDKKAPN